MKDKTFEIIIYICLIIILAIIYFACFNIAQNGYGYPGTEDITTIIIITPGGTEEIMMKAILPLTEKIVCTATEHLKEV